MILFAIFYFRFLILVGSQRAGPLGVSRYAPTGDIPNSRIFFIERNTVPCVSQATIGAGNSILVKDEMILSHKIYQVSA
ncbi:MAG: hypothetical protein AAGD96_06135 [Chloroflexota bacterium]